MVAAFIVKTAIQNNICDGGGGGGIFCYNASPKFFGCIIKENETDDVGGGLYAKIASSPEFYNCSFMGNVAEFGAGCYLRSESSPIMENVDATSCRRNFIF